MELNPLGNEPSETFEDVLKRILKINIQDEEDKSFQVHRKNSKSRSNSSKGKLMNILRKSKDLAEQAEVLLQKTHNLVEQVSSLYLLYFPWKSPIKIKYQI